jgi:hypothetical protein
LPVDTGFGAAPSPTLISSILFSYLRGGGAFPVFGTRGDEFASGFGGVEDVQGATGEAPFSIIILEESLRLMVVSSLKSLPLRL